MVFGWKQFTQLALLGCLFVLSACGGGGSAELQLNTPLQGASVQITHDAQDATRPAQIMATYSARVINVATDFLVVGGTCTQAPAPVISVDTARMLVTVRLSGGNCEGGQTLTLTVDPAKVTLENATLANTAIWTRSFAISPTSQKISGSISWLAGTVVLRINGGETVTVASDGFFVFPTMLSAGSVYTVTVDTQPAGQTCSVSNGSGVVGTSPVEKLIVMCSTDAYQVGGTVAGLTGTLELVNNGADLLTINANGRFIFPAPVAYGAGYAVTVRTQPIGQTCSVSRGTGAMGGPVSDVAVVCATNAYKVGGTASGLVGTLELLNNGVDLWAITANGSFAFPTSVAFGSPYNVTIKTQPLNQTCTVANGSGTMGGANVTNVTLVCATSIFSAGNTYNGASGAGDVFTGPIAGLNGSTFNGNAADTDAMTFTTAGSVNLNNGTTGGTLSNIKVLNLANGSNTITFANATSGVTTVVGGTGNDVVDLANTGNTFLAGTVNLGTGSNSLTMENKTYTGSYTSGSGGNDTLYLFNGTNIAGASVSGFENLVVASNATVTMAPGQSSQFIGTITAAGTETINLASSGTFNALPNIENYNLANGTNNFSSANVPVTVVGGSGVDVFNFTANQIINFLTSIDGGGGGTNILNIGATATQSIDLSTKVISNIQIVNVAGSVGTASFTNINGAGATLTYTKSTGDNTINLGSGGQTLNLLGSSSTSTTVTGSPAADTINLPFSGSGSETLIETGANMSNRTQIDTVGNFNATGTDYFKTGVNATSVGSFIIGNADTGNYLTTIGAGLAVVLNNTGQAYLITIQTGTAAGTYLFQNTGSNTAQFDNTDFFVQLTGTIGTISTGNLIQ